jgi:ABC-type dipeptide/oligopeptide/nickel transport system permease component
MAVYLAKRLLVAALLVFVTVSLNFLLFRLAPGDAANLAHIPGATPATRLAVLHQFGLDKSLWQQYLAYVNQLLHGNMGRSFTSGRPVTDILAVSMRNTLIMTMTGGMLALVVGVTAGVVAAWRRQTKIDSGLLGTSLMFYAMPAQWLGLMLILIFGSLLPTAGMTDAFAFDETGLAWVADVGRHLILPAVTYMLAIFGGYAVLARSATLDTLGEDYVLMARAKGLSTRRILRSYVLRNALLPLTTAFALSLGYAVAGTTLIETVFSWPGIGRGLYQAVLDRDYPVMQGAFLVITVSVILFNLIADLLYGVLDPRVRA